MSAAFTEADDNGLLEMVATMFRVLLNEGMPSADPNPSDKVLGDRRRGRKTATEWLHSEEFESYCSCFDCDPDWIRGALLERLEIGLKIVPGHDHHAPRGQWAQSTRWAYSKKGNDDE